MRLHATPATAAGLAVRCRHYLPRAHRSLEAFLRNDRLGISRGPVTRGDSVSGTMMRRRLALSLNRQFLGGSSLTLGTASPDARTAISPEAVSSGPMRGKLIDRFLATARSATLGPIATSSCLSSLSSLPIALSVGLQTIDAARQQAQARAFATSRAEEGDRGRRRGPGGGQGGCWWHVRSLRGRGREIRRRPWRAP